MLATCLVFRPTHVPSITGFDFALARNIHELARPSPFLGLFHDLLELLIETLSEIVLSCPCCEEECCGGEGGTDEESVETSEQILVRGYDPGMLCFRTRNDEKILLLRLSFGGGGGPEGSVLERK